MSRIRSRELESESVPTRVLRDDAAVSDKIGTHAVRRNKEAWPAPWRVRQGDLGVDVVETIVEKAADTARPTTLLLSADAVEVASETDDPVEFATVVRSQLIAVEAPTPEVVWPWAGSVQFWVEGAWDDVDPGDGVAEVLVDDVVVWSCRVATGHDGVTVLLEAANVAVANDTEVDVEFDTIVEAERHTVEVPVTGVVWPLGGVVQFYAAGRWNGSTTVEVVSVLVDDVVVWPPSWLPLPGTEVG